MLYGTKKTYKKPYKKSYNKSVSKVVKKEIKRVVGKQIEVKRQNVEGSVTTIDHLMTAGKMIDIMPVIPQSSGQGDRIGNKITLIKTTLLLSVRMYPNGYATYVDIYIFKYKKSNVSGITSTDSTKFLQDGNGSLQYTGDVYSGLRSVNEDIFTLKKHIRRTMVFGASATPLGLDNFDVCKTYKIDTTKYVKKQLVFDDTNAVPTNDNLYIAIMYTNYDATGTPVNASGGAYEWLQEIEYRDA